MDSDGNQTIVHLDHDSFFRGRVFGETNSYVNAHVNEESGLITASIALPIDTYHIEVGPLQCSSRINCYIFNIFSLPGDIFPTLQTPT